MIAEEGDLANIFVDDYCNNMNKILLITTQTGRSLVARHNRHKQKNNSQQNSTEHPQNQFIVLFPWKELLKKTITTFLEEDIQCDEVICI